MLGLITRSLIACEGQPISANQQVVARILLTDLRKHLPVVKVVTSDGGFHVVVKKHGIRDSDPEEWIDLAEFKGPCTYACNFRLECMCTCEGLASGDVK